MRILIRLSIFALMTTVGLFLVFPSEVRAQKRCCKAYYYSAPAYTYYGAGPTHHRFSMIPSPRRISSRNSGSRAAAKRFLAMLNLAG